MFITLTFRREANSEPTKWKNLNLLALPLPDLAEAKKELKILASEQIIAGVKTFVQVRLSVRMPVLQRIFLESSTRQLFCSDG